MSLTELIVPLPPVPLPRAKATDKPPLVSSFPFASLACRVIVVTPPNCTLPSERLIVDFARLTGPGVTTIVGGVEVTAEPLIVAVIVLPPARTPVNMAV